VFSGRVAQIVTQGSPKRRWVALTFDAGADRGYAGRILAFLSSHKVRASFGMTGLWALANPDLVKKMAREGDQVFNHTYDHRSFTGFSTNTAPLTWNERAGEINRAAAIIKRLTGHSPRPFFRPPYRDYDSSALREAQYLGYHYFALWTLDTLGWERISTQQIYDNCLSIGPGYIVLMHVGAQSNDAFALPRVVSRLRHRGFRFVTLEQMVAGRL
jgi:peptidoglycan/xylan/chitin deacetylase (PgdA/CDA1 family)